METDVQSGSVASPEYIQEYVPYLTQVLQSNGYPNALIGSITELPRRGRAGHPILRVETSCSDQLYHFSLHCRQEPRTLQAEVRGIEEARRLGLNVPRVVFVAPDERNELGAPFLLREYVFGVPLSERQHVIYDQPALLTEPLLILHRPQPGRFGPPLRTSIDFCRQEFQESPVARVLTGVEFLQPFDEAIEYYEANLSVLTLGWHSLVHGELHPTKILVSEDDRLVFVNWELSRLGDYCYDLAFMRFSLFAASGEMGAGRFDSLVTQYKNAFSDAAIRERLQFYLAEHCLKQISRYCSKENNISLVRFWFGQLASVQKAVQPA